MSDSSDKGAVAATRFEQSFGARLKRPAREEVSYIEIGIVASPEFCGGLMLDEIHEIVLAEKSCPGNQASRFESKLDIKKNGYVRLTFAGKGIKSACIEASRLEASS
ncbi:MAG TPA: hypothetical protein VKA70_11465 [Blastocatellia bacterium]|nr:hypothetical protein [Blastocatellia bacterium]